MTTRMQLPRSWKNSTGEIGLLSAANHLSSLQIQQFLTHICCPGALLRGPHRKRSQLIMPMILTQKGMPPPSWRYRTVVVGSQLHDGDTEMSCIPGAANAACLL